jgi:hypothetical protein
MYDQTGTWNDAVLAYTWGIGNVTSQGADAAPEAKANYVTDVLLDVPEANDVNA